MPAPGTIVEQVLTPEQEELLRKLTRSLDEDTLRKLRQQEQAIVRSLEGPNRGPR